MCSRVKTSRYDIPSISTLTVDSDETEADCLGRDACLCLTHGPSASKTGDGVRDDPPELDPFELVDPSCGSSISPSDRKIPPWMGGRKFFHGV